jgi:alkylated DNA repair dioxygenase AlkB
MGWHSDNEPELQKEGIIASVSIGITRRFDFKHNTSNTKKSIILESGSLLSMQGKTQEYWKHQLPKSKKITQARINLTFRQMIAYKH